ncbi:MAG: response regulator transcription factor [Chloroflexi bacterium]|nr:response regulator transcription factor [Chloroflexota bacterium]
MEAVTVLLVDDHAVVRQGLRAFLDVADGVTVVGEASNGQDGVDLAQALTPDVVLLDLVMPRMDGIEATRKICAASPGTRVIVLTSYGEDEKLFPAIKAGAISYLLKDISPEDLVGAIHAAKRGEATLPPGIATKLMREFAARDSQVVLEALSERELDVLREIARGRSNKEISAALGISEKTVKTHVSNILDKLHLADRTQAAIYALREKIVPFQ